MNRQTNVVAHETGDLRSEARWRERRNAVLHWRGKDWRALTGNLSCGGVKLAVHKVMPAVGDAVTLTISFDREDVDLDGIVRHVRKQPWGSIIGIEFDAVARVHLTQLIARLP